MGRECNLRGKPDWEAAGGLHDDLQHDRHGSLPGGHPVRTPGGVRLLGPEGHHPD